MPKKASIQVGDVFTDKNDQEVTVTSYRNAAQVVVRWEDGTHQVKSAQQLRQGNFSQRTRITANSEPVEVEDVQEAPEEGTITPDEVIEGANSLFDTPTQEDEDDAES